MREDIPERVGVIGILRGRRYVAIDGEGETIRLQPGGGDNFARWLEQGFLRPLASAPRLVAVRLLPGRVDDGSARTAEKSLRSRPDEIADGIALIEAIDAEAIHWARKIAGSDEAHVQAGVATSFRRDLYQPQFGLSNHEMRGTP